MAASSASGAKTPSDLPLSQQPFIITAIFVLCATVVVSVGLIVRHALVPKRPLAQKFYLRLIAINPLLATFYVLIAAFPEDLEWFHVPTSFLGAFLLASYYAWMCAAVGGGWRVIDAFAANVESQRVKRGSLCCFPGLLKGLWCIKFGTPNRMYTAYRWLMWQVMLIDPLMALIIAIATELSPGEVSPVITIICKLLSLASLFMALMVLMSTYRVLEPGLRGVYPVIKVMLIKSVVVLNVLQTFILSLLVRFSVIADFTILSYTAEAGEAQLIGLLGSLESLALALCYCAVLHPSDFHKVPLQYHSQPPHFAAQFLPFDFRTNVGDYTTCKQMPVMLPTDDGGLAISQSNPLLFTHQLSPVLGSATAAGDSSRFEATGGDLVRSETSCDESRRSSIQSSMEV